MDARNATEIMGNVMIAINRYLFFFFDKVLSHGANPKDGPLPLLLWTDKVELGRMRMDERPARVIFDEGSA